MGLDSGRFNLAFLGGGDQWRGEMGCSHGEKRI